MRFSVRAVFVLTFLVALGALAWMTAGRSNRKQAEVQQLRNEVNALRAGLFVDQPARQQAKLREFDEYRSLQVMRDAALEQFDLLHEKYCLLEQREADVLSMRSVPSLPANNGSAPAVYRLLVPQQRPVWLKFGVHPGRVSVGSASEADARKFLSRSAYEPSGPYELRLPPGDHTLSISKGTVREEALRLVIQFDEEVLLRAALVKEGLSGMHSNVVTARSQIHYAPQRPLPRLMSLRGHVDSGETDECLVWLSGKSSNFQEFPGDDI